jgi:hypothetical protein
MDQLSRRSPRSPGFIISGLGTGVSVQKPSHAVPASGARYIETGVAIQEGIIAVRANKRIAFCNEGRQPGELFSANVFMYLPMDCNDANFVQKP